MGIQKVMREPAEKVDGQAPKEMKTEMTGKRGRTKMLKMIGLG